MIRVRAIEGEPTCFHVESHEFQCINGECHRLVRRAMPGHCWFTKAQQSLLSQVGVWRKVEEFLAKLAGRKDDVPGQCKKCGAAMEVRWHRVDLAAMDCAGSCSCEHWGYALHKQLRKLTESERQATDVACSHIEAAAPFAMRLALLAHQREQNKGRKESEV